MSNQGRPLSPHLTVYRWPITMVLSILHRATGAALAGGLVVLALWLIAAASGSASYAPVLAFLQGPLGRLMLIGWSFAFFFHVSNGVRHLFWDAGIGFEKRQASNSAWFVIVLTVILTLAYWLLIQGGAMA